ncbi:MAG: OmpA family protein [Alphaproteobacteria bacterium]|nr:OmpA family protein [Alphaproteobacteria bacterium]
MRFIILHIIMLAFLTTSCTSIETLKKTKIKADDFNIELFNRYKQFAEKEAEQYDWLDSQYFIDKAMLIAYGKRVAPEIISNWKVNKSMIPELEAKRAHLMNLLKNDTLYRSHPKELAKAQYAFDCLLEELEEEWQTEDIAACRVMLDTTLNALDIAMSPKRLVYEERQIEPLPEKLPEIGKAKAEPVKAPEVKDVVKNETRPIIAAPVKPAEEPDVQEKILVNAKEFFSYRIFFEFDSANLTLGSKNTLKSIAEEVKKMKPMPEEIILNGYTDRAGVEEYNLALSKKRATSVKNFLASLGIPKEKIVIFAFGESDNAIESSDGIREPGSRRVEISLVD